MADPIPCKEIPLAAVDLKDHAFVVPCGLDYQRLITSMEEVGLLAPPWLRARPQRRFQVVAGLKRLLAAAQLGWEGLTARILPASTPDSHCLLVAFYDNAFTRGFNLLEQAVFAVRLLTYWDRQTVAAKFLPYLGLPPSAAHLDRLTALATLEEPFRKLAAQGRLALTAGAFLTGWDLKDRAAVLPYLEELPLSQSKQEEFLEGLEILARREGATPRKILSRRELKQYLVDKGSTSQEKAAAARRLLKRWVSPGLTAAQDAFGAALNRLGLRHHPRLVLKPPPAFEGPDFHLEIKFQDVPELENLLEELTRLVQQGEFAKLTHL